MKEFWKPTQRNIDKKITQPFMLAQWKLNLFSLKSIWITTADLSRQKDSYKQYQNSIDTDCENNRNDWNRPTEHEMQRNYSLQP